MTYIIHDARYDVSLMLTHTTRDSRHTAGGRGGGLRAAWLKHGQPGYGTYIREVQPGHPETYFERSRGGALLQVRRMGGGAVPRLPTEQSSSALLCVLSSVVADNDVTAFTCPDDGEVSVFVLCRLVAAAAATWGGSPMWRVTLGGAARLAQRLLLLFKT